MHEEDEASSLYAKGRDLMAAGNFATARQVFEESVALYPHFKTLELLGECLLKLDEPWRAIIPLAAATALNKQVRAPSLLAEAFLACGEPDKARNAAQVALLRDPNNRAANRILNQTAHLAEDE